MLGSEISCICAMQTWVVALSGIARLDSLKSKVEKGERT